MSNAEGERRPASPSVAERVAYVAFTAAMYFFHYADEIVRRIPVAILPIRRAVC